MLFIVLRHIKQGTRRFQGCVVFQASCVILLADLGNDGIIAGFSSMRTSLSPTGSRWWTIF